MKSFQTTVPSRLPAKRQNKTGEPLGFGYSSCRFRAPTNFNPGPAAYYDADRFSLEARGPSYSKRGFGNAFISTEDKIAYPKNNGVPGPAAYRLPQLGEGIQSGIKFGNGTKQSSIPLGDKCVPGPNAYAVKFEHQQIYSHYCKNKPSASLCSKSDRASYMTISKNPGPGDYNIDPNANTVQKTFAWSSSKTKRGDDLTRNNGVPGPAAYFKTVPHSRPSTQGGESSSRSSTATGTRSRPATTGERSRPTTSNSSRPKSSASVARPGTGQRQMTCTARAITDTGFLEEERVNMRSVGNYRGRYLGKQNDTRSPASHTFGADKDRFKNSFCGRLDLQAMLPGPGSYRLPELGEGISSGIRFQKSGKGRSPYDLADPIPGPAYYSPKRIVRTAQCQNLDGRWV